MGLILVLAGLILLLAGSGWFAAAGTVGLILLIAGAVLTGIQAIFMLVVGSKIWKDF